MEIRPKKYLGFSDIFEDTHKSIDFYLKGIDSETMFTVVPFFINASRPDHQFNSPMELLPKWFSKPNEAYCMELLKKFDSSSVFLNIISSLNLVEIAFNHNFDKLKTKSDSQIEIDLFKVYAILNQIQNETEVANQKLLPEEKSANYQNALFTQYTFHTTDLVNIDILKILSCQIYKSTEFLKYVASNSKLIEHYEIFLSRYKSKNWQEYLLKLYALVLPAVLGDSKKSFHQVNVEKDENYDSNCNFLDQFVTTSKDNHSKKDFVALRSSPIIKVSEGKYRVLSKLFLVEKIFKSLTFLFWLDINKNASSKNRIKDFRGQFTQNFSENTILYKVVSSSIPDYWNKVSGQDFINSGYDSGEPDYYLRRENKIILFESKDVIITGEIKQSRNHNSIIDALKEKFYKVEQNGRGVGIHQIINNIKRIHEKYYQKCDVRYDCNTVEIYPILIVHDRQFDSLAFNKILNEWFQIELAAIKDEIDITNVKDLTLINIDTIIYYKDIFESGSIEIDEVLSKYHSSKNKLIPFSLFAMELLDKEMDGAPKFLESMIREVKDTIANRVDGPTSVN